MVSNKVEQLIADAEHHCSRHGTRLTSKRKRVLTGLLTSKTALSAYELVDYCREEYGESMPAMSVYRILEFLQQENLAHKLKLSNKYIACSHISCDHPHESPHFLICNQCQSVKEIFVTGDVISLLEGNIEKAGFHLQSPQLEMNCICDQCMATQQIG